MKIELNGTVLVFLTIVFTILKLANVIAWSWWLVLLPALITIAVFLFVISLGITIAIMKMNGSLK